MSVLRGKSCQRLSGLILLLIPSLDWKYKKYRFLTESKDSEDRKSPPEWGISITKSNISVIKTAYSFDKKIMEYNVFSSIQPTI